jgi:phosphatidylglycerophosphate synthase
VIDANIRQLIDPPLAGAGRLLAAVGVGIAADAITVGGCLLGLAAALSASFGRFYIALVLLIASRIADGLDGAVARATRRTDRGAFLDIVLDFFVYAAVPLGFAIWSPHTNALPAAFLLASFVANGSAFLAFSIMADRRGMITTRQGQKSVYYLAGIAEGFETIAFMIAFCLFPSSFPILAMIFASLCWISAIGRLLLGWKLLAADA